MKAGTDLHGCTKLEKTPNATQHASLAVFANTHKKTRVWFITHSPRAQAQTDSLTGGHVPLLRFECPLREVDPQGTL